jgi:hypothetical protein
MHRRDNSPEAENSGALHIAAYRDEYAELPSFDDRTSAVWYQKSFQKRTTGVGLHPFRSQAIGPRVPLFSGSQRNIPVFRSRKVM